jgi:hypothetical protein
MHRCKVYAATVLLDEFVNCEGCGLFDLFEYLIEGKIALKPAVFAICRTVKVILRDFFPEIP